MDPATGGIYEGVRSLVIELEKLGISNTVYSLDEPSQNFLNQNGLVITGLGPGRGRWFYTKKLIPRLVKDIERFNAILVHGLWLFHGYGFLVAMKKYLKKSSLSTGRRVPPKFFVMPHGMLDPYFQKAKHRKVKAIRNSVYWKLIENKLVNHADGILFTTAEEMQLAQKTFSPYRPKRERNIGFGIQSPPAFISQMTVDFYKRCSELERKPHLLFLGRIDQKKGVDNLLKAYTQIVSKVENRSDKNHQPINIPQLVIAGPGLDSPFGRDLLRIVDENSILQKLVHFPGMLRGNEKWGAFYHADAFVLPSHQENFGVAVVEALACKKPVLLSNKVNIYKVIEEFNCGLVKEDSLDGTVQLLTQYFLLSVDDRKSMAANAESAFTANFTISSVAKRMRSLFYE